MRQHFLPLLFCSATLSVGGCSGGDEAFGPGEPTASEARAISEASEMLAETRAKSAQADEVAEPTSAPLPQNAGDAAPDQGQ